MFLWDQILKKNKTKQSKTNKQKQQTEKKGKKKKQNQQNPTRNQKQLGISVSKMMIVLSTSKYIFYKYILIWRKSKYEINTGLNMHIWESFHCSNAQNKEKNTT